MYYLKVHGFGTTALLFEIKKLYQANAQQYKYFACAKLYPTITVTRLADPFWTQSLVLDTTHKQK